MAVIRSCSINIDKPLGWTSRDVLNKLQSIYGYKKFGHAGSLDPLATGVLVVLVGDECKKQAYYMGQNKTYRARIIFGVSSPTNDLEGPVSTNDNLIKKDPKTLNKITDFLEGIMGETEQKVPYFSAVKVSGKELYKSSRKGNLLNNLPVKKVELLSYKILDFKDNYTEKKHIKEEYLDQLKIRDDGLEETFSERLEFFSINYPYLDIEISTSKGFYVRSLARDLGDYLGYGGLLGSLQRTAVGHLTIDSSRSLSSFSSAPDLV